MTTDRDALEVRAQRRVRRKLGFFVHAFVYLAVNLGLFALNQFTGDTRWHQFPLLGWGLGLAIHGVVTFAGLATTGLRERMLAQEIERLRRAGAR